MSADRADYVPRNPGHVRRQCVHGYPEPWIHYAHAWQLTWDQHYWCPGTAPGGATRPADK